MRATRPAFRTLLAPALLGVVLAVGTVAAAPPPTAETPDRPGIGAESLATPAPTSPPGLAVESASISPGSTTSVVPAWRPATVRLIPDGGEILDAYAEIVAPSPAPSATTGPAAPRAIPAATPRPKPKATAPTYSGRNRVWIPSLGIDRRITFYPCSESAYPGDRVYRWGCAGSNNVYLFGHAHSVFKPLHDAYVRGRLAKGMKVIHADGDGRIRTYAVSWWRVTTPDKGEFAYAALAKPGMTLQTCVGSRSQYRLVVRLALVG